MDYPLLLLGNKGILDRVDGPQDFGDLVQFNGFDRGLLFQSYHIGTQEHEFFVETFEFIGQEVAVLVFGIQDDLYGILGLLAVLSSSSKRANVVASGPDSLAWRMWL
ncbi:MAG: hypothetical protein CMJ19_16620 [Phycisphaeraceae bacterium]|nr:hypothetical protein [Phycisphaeraceae bacterium]